MGRQPNCVATRFLVTPYVPLVVDFVSRLLIRELPGQDPAVALGNAWQLRLRNIAQ